MLALPRCTHLCGHMKYTVRIMQQQQDADAVVSKVILCAQCTGG
jgi:hypothetical protein